jgi:hypothetical protein
MGLLSDFKEFYIQKHNTAFNTNELYVVKLGVFQSRTQGRNIETTFEPQEHRIMQELKPKEVEKHLKKMYGTWNSDLPDYHHHDRTSTRYFRLPTDRNFIVPCLSLEQASNLYGKSYQGVYEPKSFRSLSANCPEFVTIEEIKELENCLHEKDIMGR